MKNKRWTLQKAWSSVWVIFREWICFSFLFVIILVSDYFWYIISSICNKFYWICALYLETSDLNLKNVPNTKGLCYSYVSHWNRNLKVIFSYVSSQNKKLNVSKLLTWLINTQSFNSYFIFLVKENSPNKN